MFSWRVRDGTPGLHSDWWALNYVERTIAIIHKKTKTLWNKVVGFVKVHWQHRKGSEWTLEPGEEMGALSLVVCDRGLRGRSLIQVGEICNIRIVEVWKGGDKYEFWEGHDVREALSRHDMAAFIRMDHFVCHDVTPNQMQNPNFGLEPYLKEVRG